MGYRNYTADEYRKAGINAGPFALEGNPDPAKRNYRTERRKPILGVVMHITAGLTDYTSPDSSAEGTTKYGMNTERDASWHVCIDSNGIIPSIRDSYVAWHAGVADIPNVNDASLGIEQGTGQVDWRKAPDWWVQRTLRNDAVWLAPRVKKYGIPLVVCRDRDELDRDIRAERKFGFVAHATVAPHNRLDPGMVNGVDTYPWALLFQYIREELAGTPTSPEEDDMPTPEELWDYPTTNVADDQATMGTSVRNGYKNSVTAVQKLTGLEGSVATLNGTIAGLTALVQQLASDPDSVDMEAVKQAAYEGGKAGAQIDIPAFTAALSSELDGLTTEQIEAAVRSVFADAADGTS